jgi:phosphate transport system substrate-binding protein
VLLIGWGCGGDGPSGGPSAARKVRIDGSSTLGPLIDVASELFKEKRPDVDMRIGTSGTSAGFGRLFAENAAERIDICKASRAIEPKELERARRLGIEFIEIPIELDGIVVVVHPSNTFCTDLTRSELRRIWEPESTVNNWRDVRAGFPDLPLKLFGPGEQSGTFDVFTHLTVGKAKSSRRDFVSSESDNQLVIGVSAEPGALGYFGYSYYEANQDKLRAVALSWDAGAPAAPSVETIRSGSYGLARPCFLYVNREAVERAGVHDFLVFLLENAQAVVEHPMVRGVSLAPSLYQAGQKRLAQRRTGTVFETLEARARPLQELYLEPADR